MFMTIQNIKIKTKLKSELSALRTNYELDNISYQYNKIIKKYWNYKEEDKVEAIKISNELVKNFIQKDNKSKTKKDT